MRIFPRHRASNGQGCGRPGYALVLVMVVLALLTIGIGGVYGAMGSAAKGTGAVLAQRKVFYACDGTMRGMVKVSRDFLATGTATRETLLANLCLRGGGGCSVSPEGELTLDDDPLPLLRADGFTITDVDGTPLSAFCNRDSDCGAGSRCAVPAGDSQGTCQGVSLIASGPYRGMFVRQNSILLTVEQRRGEQACRVSQSLELGSISLFQFFLFSDHQRTRWSVPQRTSIRGRIHTNGNVFLGGAPGLYVGHLSSSGDLLPSTMGESDDGVHVAYTDDADFGIVDVGNVDQPAAGDFRELRAEDRDQPPSWAVHASRHWQDHIADRIHGVVSLKLPFASGRKVQNGRSAIAEMASNAGNLRALLEPPRITSGEEDDAEIRRLKYATQSTIRIIDGVWYVRRHELDWPGVPIWSDHPGHYVTSGGQGVVPDGIAVGQADIFTGSQRPKLFSYYRTDISGRLASDGFLGSNQRAIVSYGELAFQGAFVPFTSSTPLFDRTISIARSTRRGFRNSIVERGLEAFPDAGTTATPANATHTAANILPMNFDVGMLQAALASNDRDELGDRLERLGIEFNGIIWIDLTWPGSNGGDTGAALATLQPNGTHPDAQQPFPSAGEQRALPHTVCSDSLAGQVWASSFLSSSMRISNCSTTSRPNAIRLVNASRINRNAVVRPSGSPGVGVDVVPGQLPDGLTIASPQTVYLLGHQNLSSDPNSTNATSWVPYAVAADSVYVLSGDWRDDRSSWSAAAASGFTPPRAEPTTIRLSILTGWTVDNIADGGRVEHAIRVLEDWRDEPLFFEGALAIGHHSVYDRFSSEPGDDVHTVKKAVWRFDQHFHDSDRQPPGTPSFDIAAVRHWQRL